MGSPTAKKNRASETSYAYQRIESDLRAKVRDGRLPAGTMLTSRHNLAKEYGVALSTAQQAIANLIADGTLESSSRRGTFVAHRPVSAPPIPTEPIWPSFGPSSVPTVGTLGIVATAQIDSSNSPDIGSLWARQAIRSLEQVFSATGGTTRFFDRYPQHLGPYERGIDDENAISMVTAIETLRSEGIVALAIVGLCDGRDMSDEIVAAVDVERMPIVYISWHEVRPPLAQVYYDNNFAGYQATQHLLRKGYSRLLFVAPFREDWLADRINSARDAIRHAGMPPETLRVYPEQPVHDYYNRELADTWVYEATCQALAEEPSLFETSQPLGIIAPNDYTAYAVLRAMTEQDKVLGNDYGLVGFDDDPQSCVVGLTTVRPPIEAMGEEAGRILLRALNGERSGLQVCLRSQVMPRASTNLSVNNLEQITHNPLNGERQDNVKTSRIR